MTREHLRTARFASWFIAFLGALFLLIGYYMARTAFFRAWWLAWIFWGGLSLGAVAILSLHALTGGRWSVLFRPSAEAAAGNLPLVALLMLPAVWGLHEIFPWMEAGFFAGRARPHHAAWLQEKWFWLRACACFGLLIPTQFFLRIYTRAAEMRPAGGNPRILTLFGGAGAVLYVLTMNFAPTDWVMSLEPEWSSTIFAIIFMASQFLSALAACSVVALLLAPKGTLEPLLLRDVGNLLLAFVIFWAYVTFSQFLIIWSGNLPRETLWYVHRRSAGWPAVAVMVAVAQFLLPFVLLLARATKHRPALLAAVAACVLTANILHWYWLIAPSWHPGTAAPHWLDFAAFLTVGGLWLAAYFRKLEATYV